MTPIAVSKDIEENRKFPIIQSYFTCSYVTYVLVQGTQMMCAMSVS